MKVVVELAIRIEENSAVGFLRSSKILAQLASDHMILMCGA